jgi:hemerythrin
MQIAWASKFETGSEQIDLQHRMLINNLNHLDERLNTTNPTQKECEFMTLVVDFWKPVPVSTSSWKNIACTATAVPPLW